MKSVISTSVIFFSMLTASSALAQDPRAAGPFTVRTANYDHGDNAFSCPSADGCETTGGEMRAEVYYPENLAAGPFPLIVFLHGRHSSCYNPTSGVSYRDVWPCNTGDSPIPSHRGYDYIGKILASHGYIVASIGANGINARDRNAWNAGIVDRAYLVDAHLRLWSTFNTAGVTTDPAPFNGGLIGKIDLNRVGTMGHSRGGDGVANHYAIFGGSSLYKVRAVLPIAPINVFGTALPDINLGVLLGYCDGDVSSLEGSLFYDHSRYVDPADESSKYTFLSLGANHNFFNSAWTPDCWTVPGSCWETTDDRGLKPTPATVDDFDYYWSETEPFCSSVMAGNGRLTSSQQRAVGLAYTAAFFRHHIGGETQFGPLLRGDVAPPAGVSEVHIGYQPPASQRLDLNRLSMDAELSETTLTGTGGLPGAVTSTGLDAYDRCGYSFSDQCLLSGATREVHLSGGVGSDPGLSRLKVGWSIPGGSFVNELPVGARDVSGFEMLQFRVGVSIDVPVSMPPVAFSVTLEDGSGTVAVNTNAQLGSNDLYVPPGDEAATSVMSTLRLPLSLFSGVNLSDLRKVTLQFNETSSAEVLVSDMSFAGTAAGLRCQASNSFVLQPNSRVTTTNGSPAVNTSGSVGTTIGSTAIAGGIRSVGAVSVLDQATVQGDITSAGGITVAPSASVSGVTTPYSSVVLPPLPALPAFPAPSGNIPPINPGAPYLLPPGSYGTVTVNSGGVLRLTDGDYYFRSLTINSASRVEATAGTRVMVRDSLAFRSPFVNSGGDVQPVFLGFAGTSLMVEARFDGTMLAPNALVSFGVGAGLTYTGSFLAKDIVVRTGSSLVCTLGVGSSTPPISCSDGIKNGSETGVDCGGPSCGPCGIGEPCVAPSDCTPNTCIAGFCQVPPASLVATRTVTTDWGGGYCVTLIVSNNASVPTTNWNVSLNTNQSSIYTSWNGVFSGTSGVISVAPGASWNRVIPAAGTDRTVGFCANRTVPGSGALPIILSATGTY